MLKRKVDKLEDVPEALREFYTEDKSGKGFVLQVDDAASLKSSLDNERKVAGERQAKIDELMNELAKFKDVDPARYQELTELERKAKEKKLIDEGKIEELLQERVKAMQEAHAKDKSELEKSLKEREERLRSLMIDSAAKEKFLKHGGRETALDFAVFKARQLAEINGDQVVIKGSDGKPRFNKGGQPYSMDDLFQDLRQEADYAYHPNVGGGAPGSGDHGQSGVRQISMDSFDDNIEAIATGKAVVVG